MSHIGPYSRPYALAKIDGRTREARLLRQVRAELTAHCGGSPSATQRGLIERAAWLSLRISQLEAKLLQPSGLTEHDGRAMLAWVNALNRTYRHLSLQPPPAPPPSPMDIAAKFARPSPAA